MLKFVNKINVEMRKCGDEYECILSRLYIYILVDQLQYAYPWPDLADSNLGKSPQGLSRSSIGAWELVAINHTNSPLNTRVIT